MATSNVIHFPEQSKSPHKKHPKEKCTVLEWIRNGWQFPGGTPWPIPPKPEPSKPDDPKPGEGGAR